MEHLFTATFWIQLTNSVGVPAVFALILFIIRKSDEKRNEQIDTQRENDRGEHMKKWDSMMVSSKEMQDRHKDELERLMRLFERQTSAIELQAALLGRINANINTNQFCPLSRVKENTING